MGYSLETNIQTQLHVLAMFPSKWLEVMTVDKVLAHTAPPTSATDYEEYQNAIAKQRTGSGLVGCEVAIGNCIHAASVDINTTARIYNK